MLISISQDYACAMAVKLASVLKIRQRIQKSVFDVLLRVAQPAQLDVLNRPNPYRLGAPLYKKEAEI